MRSLTRAAVSFAALAVVSVGCTMVVVTALRSGVVVGGAVAVGAAVDSRPGCPAKPVCLPMMFTLGNQLSMSGTLFGRHCTFLVDTGFTYSVLSARHKPDPHDPAGILIQWDGDPGRWHAFRVHRWVATAQQGTNRLPLVAMGPDATSLGPHGTPTSMQGELALVQQLGDMLTDSEYDAPLGGIVGASFMKRYVVRFDYPGRCISYQCVLPEMPAGTVRVRNVGRGGLGTIVVPVRCTYRGRSVDLHACIDTGAGASIMAQKATRALLPEDDPTRRRKTHARFGDGDLEAYEFVAGAHPLELVVADAAGNSVRVQPASALLLPETSAAVSAMAGHDMLLGTSFLKDLVVTIDYTVSPHYVYFERPKHFERPRQAAHVRAE